jgi:hypothetical protein
VQGAARRKQLEGPDSCRQVSVQWVDAARGRLSSRGPLRRDPCPGESDGFGTSASPFAPIPNSLVLAASDSIYTSLCRPPHRIAVVQLSPAPRPLFGCAAQFPHVSTPDRLPETAEAKRTSLSLASLPYTLPTSLRRPQRQRRAISQHQHQVGGPPCCIPCCLPVFFAGTCAIRSWQPRAAVVRASSKHLPRSPLSHRSQRGLLLLTAPRPFALHRTAPHRLERAVNTIAQIPALARRDSTPYHTLIITRDSVSTRHHGLRNEHRGEGGQAAERGD